jgi:MFS family permease
VRASDEAFRSEDGGGFLGFLTRAPVLLAAVLAVTIVDGIILSFFQIWGLRHGVGLTEISTLLGLAIIGNALVQYPVGFLADRWSRTGVITVSAAITAVLSVALIWAVEGWALWPVTLIVGSSAFAAYTVSLAVLGDKFQGPDLIAGSAAMAVMWGVGGIAGPPLAGIAVDTFGIDAVPISLAMPFVILLALLALTGGRLVRERR